MTYTREDLQIKLACIEQTNEKQTSSNRSRVLKIKETLALIQARGDIQDIHTVLDLQRELASIEADTKARVLPYGQISSTLIPVQQNAAMEQSIIYSSVFGTNYKPRLLDRSMCLICSTKYIVNTMAAQTYCPSCGVTFSMYEDTLDNQHTRGKIGTTVETSQRQIYRRPPLYKKFIQQYNEHMPEIPVSIYDTILRELFKTHTFDSSKCRPTPIIAILRKHKYTQWIPYALKISRILNNERSDLYLKEDTIMRLMERFNEIIAFTKEDKKEKFLNYEFLTHQMLLMDDKVDNAWLFKCHKTEGVYERSMSRLKRLISLLEQRDTVFEWFVPSQICNFEASLMSDDT